jgi:hypothetical protein
MLTTARRLPLSCGLLDLDPLFKGLILLTLFFEVAQDLEQKLEQKPS